MNETDLTRLQHIADAAAEVMSFIEGQTRSSLDTNQLLVRGLSMSIGIMGEAAGKLTQETRDAYPHIPWPQIIGMRNRLIHAYFEVNLDILWETASVDIPALLKLIEKIMSAESHPSDEGNIGQKTDE